MEWRTHEETLHLPKTVEQGNGVSVAKIIISARTNLDVEFSISTLKYSSALSYPNVMHSGTGRDFRPSKWLRIMMNSCLWSWNCTKRTGRDLEYSKRSLELNLPFQCTSDNDQKPCLEIHLRSIFHWLHLFAQAWRDNSKMEIHHHTQEPLQAPASVLVQSIHQSTYRRATSIAIEIWAVVHEIQNMKYKIEKSK